MAEERPNLMKALAARRRRLEARDEQIGFDASDRRQDVKKVLGGRDPRKKRPSRPEIDRLRGHEYFTRLLNQPDEVGLQNGFRSFMVLINLARDFRKGKTYEGDQRLVNILQLDFDDLLQVISDIAKALGKPMDRQELIELLDSSNETLDILFYLFNADNASNKAYLDPRIDRFIENMRQQAKLRDIPAMKNLLALLAQMRKTPDGNLAAMARKCGAKLEPLPENFRRLSMNEEEGVQEEPADVIRRQRGRVMVLAERATTAATIDYAAISAMPDLQNAITFLQRLADYFLFTENANEVATHARKIDAEITRATGNDEYRLGTQLFKTRRSGKQILQILHEMFGARSQEELIKIIRNVFKTLHKKIQPFEII